MTDRVVYRSIRRLLLLLRSVVAIVGIMVVGVAIVGGARVHLSSLVIVTSAGCCKVLRSASLASLPDVALRTLSTLSVTRVLITSMVLEGPEEHRVVRVGLTLVSLCRRVYAALERTLTCFFKS